MFLHKWTITEEISDLGPIFGNLGVSLYFISCNNVNFFFFFFFCWSRQKKTNVAVKWRITKETKWDSAWAHYLPRYIHIWRKFAIIHQPLCTKQLLNKGGCYIRITNCLPWWPRKQSGKVILGHPEHPHSPHTHVGWAIPELKHFFSIYWPFVQYLALLTRPPHTPKSDKYNIFLLSGPFLV